MRSLKPALVGLGLAGQLSVSCTAVVPPPPPPPPEPIAETPEPVAEETVAEDLDPIEVLNEGAWTARDPGSDWYLRYRFRDGRYSTADHPTWEESGRVEVTRVEGRQVSLRFVDRIYDGRRDDALEQELVIAEDGASFLMGGRRFVLERAVQVAAQRDDEQ